MNKEKYPCMHTKAEEQYICLEESCIMKSEFKLDCVKCLEKTHNHKDSIQHIEGIVIEAQQNKQTLVTSIDQNLEFCANLKQRLQQSIGKMKQQLHSWLDQQNKLLLEQVEKYQLILCDQQKKISATQLTKDQIKNIVEYKLLNNEQFNKENLMMQKLLTQNEQSFNQYFATQFERMSKNYNCNIIQVDELPKLQQQQLITKQILLEKCTSNGCCNIKKTSFCLSKNCLMNENLTLDCPRCQVKQHISNQNYDEHQSNFIDANSLWELQDKYIDEVDNFCLTKGSEIEQESQQLQQIIIECQKNNEQKLHFFRHFMIQKEKEILNYLQKFKSQYQKEKFTIYKELLLQTDFSVLGDIVELEKKFKSLAHTFKSQFQKEKEITQQQFQDQWMKGMCLLQADNILQLQEKFVNPVSKHIQQLNDMMNKVSAELQTLKQQQEQMKKQLDLPMSANDSTRNFFSKLMNQFDKLSSSIQNLNQNFTSDNAKIMNTLQSISGKPSSQPPSQPSQPQQNQSQNQFYDKNYSRKFNN